MPKKIAIAVVLLFLGVMLTFYGARESIVFIKGTTVDINSAGYDDLDKVAMVKGEIAYVIGRFAVNEESEKTFGVTTSTHETAYYLVETVDRRTLIDYISGKSDEMDDAIVVVAARTDEMKSALDRNYQEWDDYLEGKTDSVPAAVSFEGKLWKQPKDDDYISYRDDFIRECELNADDVAEYEIVDTKIDAGSIAVFGLGIVLLIIGIIDAVFIVRRIRGA